ncbi:DUF418 domain-containing protein [Parachitinimonas caeni]|uniref:DUF418 domain-containing protein n=1 Tax=Parachitinimonas caeni TaxID=3031301 RepID=A0ABT7DW81_9NEIS|nr:DUF418 domain-containing protein [Parachitinimonas caeni]MDK2124312.1 DUF418 domain-containing protein [Parachitinimonas caeni]
MSRQRIAGFDLARALAIFGMVIVNFKTVMHTDHQPDGGWWSLFDLVDGRAAAMFVTLAGVGISLSAGGDGASEQSLQQARSRLLWRALWLLVGGLAYIEIWPADILHYYGVYLCVGAMLLATPSRILLALACVVVALVPLLHTLLDYGSGWDWQALSYRGFWSVTGFVRNLFFNGFHPVFPWIGFLLIGMVLGRPAWLLPEKRRVLLTTSLLVCALTESLALGCRWLMGELGQPRELADFLFSTTPMPPQPFYFISAAASAIAIIVSCVAIAERFADSAWLKPLIHTGQLALTLYLAHVLIGMSALEAMGLITSHSASIAIGSALAFCVGAVVFASLWRRRFRQGPVEWLLRRLSTF